jgi:hypothetical protein
MASPLAVLTVNMSTDLAASSRVIIVRRRRLHCLRLVCGERANVVAQVSSVLLAETLGLSGGVASLRMGDVEREGKPVVNVGRVASVLGYAGRLGLDGPAEQLCDGRLRELAARGVIDRTAYLLPSLGFRGARALGLLNQFDGI